MSESDCDCGGCEVEKTRSSIAFLDPNFAIMNPETPNDVFDYWDRISVEQKKRAGHLMKICAFWLPILLQRDESSSVACWAAQVGLVEPNKDVNLKHIHKIEILEAILRALVKGTLQKAQTKQMVCIGNRFYLHSPEVLENALLWLERAGEPNIRPRVLELGHLDICFKALHLVFVEFTQYVKALAYAFDQTMLALTARPADMLIKRSEEMKRKGNEHFQKRLYEDAVKFYTKAVKLYPDNHIIYGNRALCHIKSNNFIKALGDGKRATLIKPLWAKGHYRYCEALFGLGEVRRALEANSSAQILCREDPEGIKDLEMQYHKFTAHISQSAANAHLKTNMSQRSNQTKEASTHPSGKEEKKVAAPPNGKAEKKASALPNGKAEKKAAALPNGKAEKKAAAHPNGKAEKKAAAPLNGKAEQKATAPTNGKAEKMAAAPPNGKAQKKTQPPSGTEKKAAASSSGTEKNTMTPPNGAHQKAGGKATPVKKESEENRDKKTQHANNKSTVTPPTLDTKPAKSGKPSVQDKAETRGQERKSVLSEPKKETVDRSKELSTAVRDGHTALDDSRSRNAEQAFNRALALVGPGAFTKVPGLSSIDVLLLQYGRATALTQIGRPEELSEAVQLLDRIQASEERTFQCLVCLAYGRVCVKENRYRTALAHFSDGLQMVKNKITPGKLTWPLTRHLVPETQVDYLMDLLEDFIELCKFPPLPDAICRLENCNGSAKKEIYFTDPDFKGFIQIHCCQSCRVEYHMSCWKSLKNLAFYEKSEKDILQDPCLTPDCTGQINNIQIYGTTGLVKCKFEVAIPKPVTPKKPKVNQRCTSIKKLKLKEEHQLRRKLYKQPEECEGASTETARDKTPPRAHLYFRDHVLLQISQHMDLLRQERSSFVSVFSLRLKPWLQLDRSRGNPVAVRLIQCLEEPAVSLGAAVELLLERRNRVWARIFIHSLSDCVDLQPKVSSWAQRLDSAGLSAAQYFMESYSEELEQLNLSLLLHFSPVQEIILEKLGSKPEAFSSLGLSLTEYLRQSPAQDMRLFIWALEEHRQHYVSCHSILDHYFDMMDGLCSVFKKTEDANNISSPSKSKHRGRKKRGPKPTLVWASPRAGSAAEEWDPGLLEEDSLTFFSVPPHLRQQLALFEEQYRTSSPTNRVSHSHPQLSRDTLYEYFTQILEEHGPLVADDPLLVGELKNFPVSAQQQIYSAGGLEAFLLGSPAFKRFGVYVGLSSSEGLHPHAQDSLDQLDVIDSNISSIYQSSFFYLRETYPTLPTPCVFDLYTDSGMMEPFSPPAASGSTPAETEGEPGQRPGQKNQSGSGQGAPELLCVAVNTEMIQEYESSQGELNSLLKLQQDMQQQVSSMCGDRETQRLQMAQELRTLQEELDQVMSCVQVTQQELALFQHKLEEEVKKDQKDKKEHQEQLKGLKQELERLQQEHQRLKRSIRDKKSARETRLQDFIQLSNQCAAERMSLEDEIKRCKASVTRGSRRSLAAQLSALKSGQELSLYPLRRELLDSKAVLWRLGDMAQRFPAQELEATQNSLRAGIQEIQNKIVSTEAHYNKLMEEVRSGIQWSDLQPVNEALSAESDPVQVPEAAPMPPPQPSAGGSASPLKRKKQKKTQELPNNTVFERAVERLGLIFPDTSRSELRGLIQRFRLSSGGLQSMGVQDVVGRVSQLILDQQEEKNRARATSGASARATPPLGNSASVWQPLEPHRTNHVDALNSEDPCIICHDDMTEEDMCVLECRHSFHKECIRSWLKEQRTCPTCRDHTLLPEDFPALSTKRHI